MTGDFTGGLQKKILKELRAIYSGIVIQHWQHPRNWGIMNKSSGYAKITGPCGDTMEISIRVKQGIIVRCTFDTDGCGVSIVCGSIMTEMATGLSVSDARNIDQQQVLAYCGGLPEEDQHCALLAVNTLRKAVDDFHHKHP